MRNKFKVGDKVKVIKNDYCGNDVGTILTVRDRIIGREIDMISSYKCIYFKESSLYNISNELKLVPKERKVYKVGDTVIFNTKKGILEGELYHNYLRFFSNNNKTIFEYLGIKNRFKFCSQYYECDDSSFTDFPEYTTMKQANDVINALLDLCDSEDDIKYINVKPIIIKYKGEF
jgi:hypothetical protein